MSLSMHQICVPSLVRTLTNLRTILSKGREHAVANEIDPKSLIEFRLYPNMLPLRWQIYIATDTAKFAVARLSGVDAPKFDDTEASFEELDERIAKTLTYLNSVEADQIDGTETKKIVMKRRGSEWTFAGQDYLLGFVLPQVYFHVTTAYAMLRHNGVEIGKMDYMGPPAA